ncbi:hypothetical protein [Gemmatimonas sp.]|jgi:hypothetical protein|uniref:hypothetical protein n=1 Tax=Gemmatimonas sp. TaxID=1962908 RepID=UPI0037BEE707
MASWYSHLRGVNARVAPPLLHGIAVELRNTQPAIANEAVLERLAESLALVATYAPERLRHMQRDVRAIRVERFPTRGAFLPGERVILTELTFLARRDISAAPVASSILHEGVHARVHAFRARVGRGVPAADDMAREERLCRRAELSFGRRLPLALGAPVVERALASLALADHHVAPTVDWALARERQERVDRGEL